MAVVFDPAAFAAQYPEFSGLATGLTTFAFNEATLFLNNTPASVVTDETERRTLLYLLTAHVTKLTYGTNNGTTSEAPAGIVGRVEVAKEGSVHVRADMGPALGSPAWYNQTQYGATYWAATVKYRTMHYYPGLSRGRTLRGLLRWSW